MIRCYLDNQSVPPPQGLDYLQFTKSRNRSFWGFMYRQLGFVDGLSTMAFTDTWTVDYLTAVYKRYGVQAQTSFRLEDDQQGTLYDGWINYAQKESSPTSFSFSLRDDQTTTQLETGSTTLQSVACTQPIALTGRQLDGTANLQLDAERAVFRLGYRPTQQVYLNYGVPLQPVTNAQPIVGSLLTLGSLESLPPFYRNTTTTDQTLRLVGSLRLQVESDATGLAELTLTTSSAYSDNDATLAYVPAYTASPSPMTVAVDARFTVPPNGTAALYLRLPFAFTRCALTYQALNLSISRQEVAPDSLCYGREVTGLLADLVSQLTGGQKTAVCQGLDGLFLTNGANLRGVNLPMSVSLRQLWDGLNAIFCLRLDVRGKKVFIRPRQSVFDTGRVTYLERLLTLREKPNPELLFSEVVVGYSGANGAGLLSGLDPHTGRTYQSDITMVRASLDLSTALITSGSLIETQRRLQFDTASQSASTSTENDAALYLIRCQGTDANRTPVTLKGLDAYRGLVDAQTSYNLELTPRRNLGRWLWLLTGIGSLKLTQTDLRQDVVTKYAGEIGGVSENQALITQTRTNPDVWTIQANLTLPQYASLGDFVQLADGRTGLLMDATWRRADQGDLADLVCWTIQL